MVRAGESVRLPLTPAQRHERRNVRERLRRRQQRAVALSATVLAERVEVAQAALRDFARDLWRASQKGRA